MHKVAAKSLQAYKPNLESSAPPLEDDNSRYAHFALI